MPRQVDLRHDRDVPRRRVVHDLLQVVARVEVRPVRLRVLVDGVTVAPGQAPERRAAQGRRRTHRAVLGEFGQPRHVDAPALVLGEVPVQDVQLVHRHRVDEAAHDLLPEEVPPFVQHEPAPLERRRILYLYAGIGIAVPQLVKRLLRVETPRRVRRRDDHLVRTHGQAIALGGNRRVRDRADNRAGRTGPSPFHKPSRLRHKRNCGQYDFKHIA